MMKLISARMLVVLLIAVTSVVILPSRGKLSTRKVNREWKKFKVQYNKSYDRRSEERHRRTVFEQNVNFVNEHNKAQKLGKYSYTLRINRNADLTAKEVVQRLQGLRVPPDETGPVAKSIQKRTSQVQELPDSINWTQKGYRTPVRSQGDCGACWAFAAAAALEAQWWRKTGRLVQLSVQNLIDCNWGNGNAGCEGGQMGDAFDYIKKNGGIDTERSYPYQETDWYVCKFARAYVGATCSNYVKLNKTEDDLKKAVASFGPVAVGIDASSSSFTYFGEGIYNNPLCGVKNDISHAVLVVGYGTENGLDYWLIKNSYGTDWGMNGYGKMARNKNNQCGIANYAVYPIVHARVEPGDISWP